MEESNEVEASESFQSPPRKRRSTFFDKRESFVPQQIAENVDPNICKQNTDASEKTQEKLMQYYDNLLSEKEQWKKEANNRRNKYHDLRQQFMMAAKASGCSKMSYSALTNEDIEFVKARANISKLVDSQQQLHKSLKEMREFYRRTRQLDDVVLSSCEFKVNKITNYILENSSIEPKN